jgi:hypothetical protein
MASGYGQGDRLGIGRCYRTDTGGDDNGSRDVPIDERKSVMPPRRGRLTAALVAAVCLATPVATIAPSQAHPHVSPGPAAVLDWNAIGLSTILGDTSKAGIESYTYLAFMHAAVYNAVVGIEGGYRPYRFRARAPHRASSEAAAVAAAHKILVTYSPYATATLDAAYTASLAGIPDGGAKREGVEYGELAADTLIAQRVGDGRNDPAIQWVETPNPAPGVWRRTPPAFAPFNSPWLAYMKPLAVRSGAQFGLPRDPPALTSRRYTRDFNEVKALGSTDPASRTPEQNATARFWTTAPTALIGPVGQLNSGLRDQVAVRDLDLVEAARMFVAVYVSMADATVSIWRSKLVYGLWRPITAIRMADTDGNPATAADPSWTPLIPTPPYPDYVSGYNGVVGAYTRALQEAFCTRRLRLTLPSNADPGVTRFYGTGRQVRREVIDVRVWHGVHFRTADTVGARMGQQVGRWVLDHYFQPSA